MVDASGIARQIAAAMRDDQLQPRIIFEYAAENQMMDCHGRVERIADHIGEIMFVKPARFGEAVGMHEDDEPQLLASRKDRAEARLRQIRAGDMRHDLDAAEPKRFVQPVEFGERQLGRLQRHCAEAGEAVGKAAAHLGDLVVENPRRGEAEIGIGAVIGLARRRRDRLDVDAHVIHVGDALLGRHALQVGALAVLPIGPLAPLVGRGFEKPARHRLVTGDHRGRLVAANMTVDVDGEPFAARMRRARKASRDRSAGRQAGEQHRQISALIGSAEPTIARQARRCPRNALRMRRRCRSGFERFPGDQGLGAVAAIHRAQAARQDLHDPERKARLGDQRREPRLVDRHQLAIAQRIKPSRCAPDSARPAPSRRRSRPARHLRRSRRRCGSATRRS